MKPTLFLIHGWNMPPLVWDAVLRKFDGDIDIQLATLPGYEDVEAIPTAPPPDSLTALLAQAPTQAHWCGWSLGATLAMQAALKAPERILKLTLISPTPCFVETDNWPHGISAAAFERLLHVAQKKYSAGLKRFLQMQLPGEPQKGIVDQLSQRILDHRPTDAALRSGYEALRDTDLRQRLTEINVPTQIIAASQDNVISPDASRFCADHIPNASFHLLGDCHCLPATQPRKLAEHISVFSNHDTIDRAQVARQFSKAAPTYDNAAQVQRELGQHLIDQIPPSASGALIDLGCGTGEAVEQISKRCPDIKLTGVDVAPAMIEKSRERVSGADFLIADIEKTGLADNIAKFVFSCAAMQWCQPKNAIAEAARLLEPGGQFLMSTFVAGTLPEFREAWRRVSPNLKRVHDLPEAPHWRQALTEIGFEITEFNQHRRCQTFASVDELLLRFRQLGASYAGHDRRPLTRNDYTSFREQLSDLLGTPPKLTYECLTIVGRKPRH